MSTQDQDIVRARIDIWRKRLLEAQEDGNAVVEARYGDVLYGVRRVLADLGFDELAAAASLVDQT